MAKSNAERQAAWQQRRNARIDALQQQVQQLHDELAAANDRIHELEGANAMALRLTPATTAQQVVDRLTSGVLGDFKLAAVWVALGEYLKRGPMRGQDRGVPGDRERRQERRLAKYLYPTRRA